MQDATIELGSFLGELYSKWPRVSGNLEPIYYYCLVIPNVRQESMLGKGRDERHNIKM